MTDNTGYTRAEAKLCVLPGWHKLIDKAYDLFDQYPDIIISTVKQKYGSLRINFHWPDEYYDPDNSKYDTISQANDDLFSALNNLDDVSCHTCELCGQTGKWCEVRGWQYTLCQTCQIKLEQEHDYND